MKNVILFSVMETDYSKPLITVCNETSVKNASSHHSEQCGTFFSYENRSNFSEQCGTFFQLWRHITQTLWLFYAVKPQSNKNVFTLQWTMWYFFSVMETEPTSVNNVVLFSVMETYYSTPLITVCSETSIQKKRLPTAVNNVVLFFSYGDKLLNPFN